MKVFSNFWQDLAFGGCFFPVKILFEKVLTNWFFQLLAGSWFWWLLFSCWNFDWKSIEQLFFPAFGRILVLVAAFFLLKFWLKKYWTIVFSSFWQDLGFGGCFFPVKILSEKVLKNWFFQLLAGSWFWWLFFSCWNFDWTSIENLFFPAFGRILVLVAAFFLLKC